MYCLQCGDEFVAGITACPDCEVPLVNELPRAESEPPEAEELVTVATFRNLFDASVARGALESAGIPAFVPGENMGSFALDRTGAGRDWVEMKVSPTDRGRALEILRKAGHT